MEKARSKSDVVRLDYKEGDRQVLITPDSQDRFVLTCAAAIEACRNHQSAAVMHDEIIAMFEKVRQWASVHAQQVKTVYVNPRAGQLVVFVVSRFERFSLDFSDLLTELDLEIRSQFRLLPVEVLQIPGTTPDQTNTFVDEDAAILYDESETA